MYIKIEGDDSSEIRFPVLPPSFERQLTINNQQIDVNQIGTVNLIGKPGLQTVQIDAFFPHEYNSSFCQVGEGELKAPYEYVNLIEQMERKICRLIISDSINMMVLIDSFTYAERDGTRDVSFSLVLTEYKQLSSSRVKISNSKSKNKTYTTKACDTLKKIAKKQLKDAKKWKAIYKKNKKKCDKAFKSDKVWGSSDTGSNVTSNKQRALKNKWFPKGVKLTLPKK